MRAEKGRVLGCEDSCLFLEFGILLIICFDLVIGGKRKVETFVVMRLLERDYREG